jgi:glycosyltransferase involved in cell wall biosynthesis
MRVSIVITSHNHQPYVGEAIDSALAQTHPDVEVIAVDDGSTDASAAVAARYEANGVRVVLQENRGQAGAVNAGYALATGELAIFLDADDVLLTTAASAAVSMLEEGVAQVQWPLAEIDARGRLTGETTPVAKLSEGDLLGQLLEAGPLQWASSGLGAAWARRYLERVMPVPEPDFWYGADAYLVALAPLYGQVRALEQPHTLYRRHSSNHSGRPFDEMISFDTEIARKLFALTADRARARGLEVDPARWERANWSLMAARSLAEIDAVVGRTVPFVLIDGMQLSLEPRSGRRVIPFLEHDGQYWGEPEDDQHAIDELERLRREGARFLVLAWPSFCWLDDYPRFIEHLNNSYGCVLDNERLRIFALAP